MPFFYVMGGVARSCLCFSHGTSIGRRLDDRGCRKPLAWRRRVPCAAMLRQPHVAAAEVIRRFCVLQKSEIWVLDEDPARRHSPQVSGYSTSVALICGQTYLVIL